MSQIRHKGVTYEIDDSLSNKDFTGWDFTKRSDLSGKVIYNSCFSNETPDKKIFQDALVNVTFVACNLDNVFIPGGNLVVDGTFRRFKVQNDLEDWVLDGQGKALEPINKKLYGILGISADPKDIPTQKLDKSIVSKKLEDGAKP